MYLQSLLRDRLFTVRTDHRNLLFITEASNPMIVRWYMALSEFSFTLEFIPGVDNDIADSLSRLCRNIEMDSLYMTQYGELIRYILVNILSASQSYYYS